jgi:hypothetical protein
LEGLGKWRNEALFRLGAREEGMRMGSSRDPLVALYRGWATREKLGIYIQK